MANNVDKLTVKLEDLFELVEHNNKITLYIKPDYIKNIPFIVFNNVSIRVKTSENRDTIQIETVGIDDSNTLNTPSRNLQITNWLTKDEYGRGYITVSRKLRKK